MPNQLIRQFRLRVDPAGAGAFLEGLAGGLRDRRFDLIAGGTANRVFSGRVLYLRVTVDRLSGRGQQHVRLRVSFEWKTVPLERSRLHVEGFRPEQPGKRTSERETGVYPGFGAGG